MNSASRSRLPVLIVEDNPHVQHLLTLYLKRAGYDAAHAANGDDALALLQGGLTPCAILLDYHMPIMDGGRFRREQLARDLQTDIPVVLYSSDSMLREDDLQFKAVFSGHRLDYGMIVRAIEQSR